MGCTSSVEQGNQRPALSETRVQSSNDVLGEPVPTEEEIGAEEVDTKDYKANSDSTPRVVVEFEALSLDDIGIGEMKEIAVPSERVKIEDASNDKVLVVRTINDEVYAMGSKCTHYGAPLAKGALCMDRVVCPFHAACFNVKSGDIEEAPALDAIPHFPSRKQGNKIVVEVPNPFPASFKRTQKMVRVEEKKDDSLPYVIIGGGPAAVSAAETMRQNGFKGRIVMLSASQWYPFDRIKLTKNMAMDVNNMLLRPKEFYEAHGIEVKLNHVATKVDTDRKVVEFRNGESLRTIGYEKLLLATGAKPRTAREMDLTCDVGHIDRVEGVYTIRNPQDASDIEATIKEDSAVVILGASFIALEAASYLVGVRKHTNVSVVARHKYPFRMFGDKVGKVIHDLHAEKGTKLVMTSVVTHIENHSNGKVSGVRIHNLETGEDTTLPADVVILGLGATPATEFLKDSNIVLGKDGAVKTDECLAVEGVKDVWAAGDMAFFPYRSEGHVRIEHWDVALGHGRVAALNMIGMPTEFTSVPFFWTVHFGLSLRYTGLAKQWSEVILQGYSPSKESWDEVLLEGDLSARKFAAYFVSDSEVRACATLGYDPVTVITSELLRIQKMATPAQLSEGLNIGQYMKDTLHAFIGFGDRYEVVTPREKGQVEIE